MNQEISNIKYQISNSLTKIANRLIGEDVYLRIESNTDLSRGDFSLNAAMTIFATHKFTEYLQPLKIKSPMELAEKIVEELKKESELVSLFKKIEVASPGFINFWLSREEISRQMLLALEGSKKIAPSTRSNSAKASLDKSKKVIFEFGDPNPFKEPHIGHLRNFALGESISRLLENEGAEVVRASYQGDVGAHVAKALYGLLQIRNPKSEIRNLDEGTLEERVKLLGKAYAAGAKAYEEDENAKAEIISINNKIYTTINSKFKTQKAKLDIDGEDLFDVWQKGREISLDYFEQLYEKLGIKYDKYYFESQTAPIGKEIVENHPEVFEKHDNAVIFRGEKYGLHTRVFVTKENYATYEGKDLALAVLKDKDFPETDKSIIMTANEQVEYFKVLLKALELIDKRIADKTMHLSFGFVNLKEGKMSSRSGNVVPANWLLQEIRNRLKKGFKEVSEGVLDGLSVGAVKWSMLRFSRESNISFSIDESIQIEGNSGPYMQYAYARTQSILEKAGKTPSEAKKDIVWENQELALARIICQFENVKKTAAETFSPNILTNYLFNLAQNFNNFYEKEKVIGSEREEERLAIVSAVGKVLQKGLYLLGIESPEKI